MSEVTASSNAFEVTYSEISHFAVEAEANEVVSGKPITVTAAAVLAGSVDNAIDGDGVAVRVWLEPVGADVSAFSELELSIVPPSLTTWEDKRESKSKPVYEGVLVNRQQFQIVSNTEVSAKFEIEEILDEGIEIEPASGSASVTWGVREDFLLAMDIQPVGGEALGPTEGPLQVVSGERVEVVYELAYADQNTMPAQGQNIEFFVQDQNGFLPAFHINPSRNDNPERLPQLIVATQPPATETPDYIQLIAWELGRDFDLQSLVCPAPMGALYTCAAPIEVRSGEAAGWRLETGVNEVMAGEWMSLVAKPVDVFGNGLRGLETSASGDSRNIWSATTFRYWMCFVHNPIH